MTLIVEDGTGLPDAESYTAVAEADAYHSARGNDAWSALTPEAKEQCLRKATDYMLQAYRPVWRGLRAKRDQALDWPRLGVRTDTYVAVLQTIVPKEVKAACSELALRASSGSLNDDQETRVKQETVGPITTVYDTSSPQNKRFRAVDMILQPLLVSSGSCSTKVGRR